MTSHFRFITVRHLIKYDFIITNLEFQESLNPIERLKSHLEGLNPTDFPFKNYISGLNQYGHYLFIKHIECRNFM